MTRFNLSNGLFWAHHTVQTKFYTVQILRWLKHTCVPAKSLQLCLTLCDTLDCSLSGSSVHEILQPRKLECVVMTSCKWSSQPRDQTCVSCVSCIGRWILYHWVNWEAHGRYNHSPYYYWWNWSLENWVFWNHTAKKCKPKLQDSTSYQSEWSSSKNLQTIRVWRKGNSPALLVGM